MSRTDAGSLIEDFGNGSKEELHSRYLRNPRTPRVLVEPALHLVDLDKLVGKLNSIRDQETEEVRKGEYVPQRRIIINPFPRLIDGITWETIGKYPLTAFVQDNGLAATILGGGLCGIERESDIGYIAVETGCLGGNVRYEIIKLVIENPFFLKEALPPFSIYARVEQDIDGRPIVTKRKDLGLLSKRADLYHLIPNIAFLGDL